MALIDALHHLILFIFSPEAEDGRAMRSRNIIGPGGVSSIGEGIGMLQMWVFFLEKQPPGLERGICLPGDALIASLPFSWDGLVVIRSWPVSIHCLGFSPFLEIPSLPNNEISLFSTQTLLNRNQTRALLCSPGLLFLIFGTVLLIISRVGSYCARFRLPCGMSTGLECFPLDTFQTTAHPSY